MNAPTRCPSGDAYRAHDAGCSRTRTISFPLWSGGNIFDQVDAGHATHCTECGAFLPCKDAIEKARTPVSTFSPRTLARMTLDEVDSWYRRGGVSQDQYEAYRHVWATHPAHEGYDLSRGWTETPEFPEVLVIVEQIRAAL